MSNTTSQLPNNVESQDSSNIGFELMSTALVWIMILGVGFFYSGMARKKNALSLLMLCMLSISIVSIQWFVCGYSLTYGSGSSFIGNLNHAFYIKVDTSAPASDASYKIPELTFAAYQCMFAAITPALAIGAAAERGRVLPAALFILIWTTLVYDPIAHWNWSPNGWSKKLGGLDFAGGTPVHISSGFAALAYCLILEKRNVNDGEGIKAHNVSHIILGTALLWFGWFGFNGGSALEASPRSTNAFVVTNLSASFAGLTWMALDYKIERKLSAIGFCSGAVAGLVAITPGSGYVAPPASVLIGFLGGLCCNLAAKIKEKFQFDDACDVFAVHAVGGFVGNLLTGIFAQKSIAFLGGAEKINGGWLDGHWVQIAYQFVDSVAGGAYSFVVTFLILFLMNKVPGLSLRADPASEEMGLDHVEIGESAYHFIEEIPVHAPQIEMRRVMID